MKKYQLPKFLTFTVVMLLIALITFVLIYNRYFDYAYTTAHYRVFVDCEPDHLFLSDNQTKSNISCRHRERLKYTTWLNIEVDPQKIYADSSYGQSKINFLSLEKLDLSYIQENSNEIHKLVNPSDDALTMAKKYSRWIKDNIPYEEGRIYDLIGEVNVKFSDGQRLMTIGTGTIEYANVFAAIMRSHKIPTKVVGGHIFSNNKYMTQIWNEIWIEGSGWVLVDVSSNRIGRDNRYISFFEGESPGEFIKALTEVEFGVERTNW